MVDSALNRRDPETHSSLTEMAVRLTKEEATRLTGELNDVVERWAASTRGGHDDDRRTYLYYGMVLPHPETPASDA